MPCVAPFAARAAGSTARRVSNVPASAQQTTNDPGGDRWLRLIDELVDMYADYVLRNEKPRRQ